MLYMLFILICSDVYSNIDIVNNVWMVSSMVTGSVSWAEKFLEIENLAKEKKWDAASKLAKKSIKVPGSTSSYLSNGEPYSLVLDGLNIAYRIKAGERQDITRRITRDFLDRNYAISKGRIFYSYKYISQKYRKSCLDNDEDYFSACKEIINYDPYDKAQILYLIDWVGNHNDYSGELLNFAQELQFQGVILSPDVYLALIKKITLPNNDKADKLIRWLNFNQSAYDNYISDAIDMLLATTEGKNQEILSKAHNCLMNLALHQGPDNSRITVIAKAMKACGIVEERAAKPLAKNTNEQNTEKYKISYSKLSQLSGTNVNWAGLRENVAYLWSAEHSQRYGNESSLSDLIDSLDKIEELKKRLKDKGDKLEDIDKYANIHLIPGVSGQLYWLAEKLFWIGEYDKCFNALNFFLLPENKDSFTIGAAHFYLGRMLKQLPSRKLNNLSREEALKHSLDHLLIVHNYSTCLTYISYSYIMAAENLNELGCVEQALALCMVDVPSIDYAYVKTRRHENAADYCLTLDDKISCVRHLQEMMKYAGPQKGNEISQYIKKTGISQKIWDDCATNFFTVADMHQAIENAMIKPCPVDSDLLFSALTHSWPSLDDIPLSMATNRVLNNNVNLTKK